MAGNLEQEAINRLQRTEIRFHIAKILIIVAVSVLTGVAIINYVHKDNERTRAQINCIVDGFLQQDQQQIVIAEHRCRN